ncbi:cytochrome c oxidase assembly factor Coa1 family protein [Rubrivirga sp. IMCC45206]|uniref:cytochrome c oxidase assembly factor Coa1 family protein n=1 Tax=Rubrivirga sp. IMCC45206 TaxID=3391614 RepID=UPI00398FFAE0
MRPVSSVLALLVGVGLFMAAVWAGCSTVLKANDAYERGLATALADPVVEKTLGAPVRESWFINGSIEGDGMRTEGAWSTRIRGTEHSGTLHIRGYKTHGQWRVVAMSLVARDERFGYVPGQGFRDPTPGSYGDGPPDILGD